MLVKGTHEKYHFDDLNLMVVSGTIRWNEGLAARPLQE